MMSPSRTISSLELRDRRLSFFVGRLAIVAAIGHTFILAFSLLADVRILVYFNIGSVTLYLLLFLLNRTGRYTLVLIATMVEVLAHAAVATILLGWDAAFHLYLLCLIPLLFYVDRWPLAIRGVASVMVLLMYIILAVIADQVGQPVQAPDTRLLPVVRYGNMAITAAVLIALSAFYQAAVARAERYMQHYSSTLEKLSNMDPLTGILNRRGTVAALDRALALGSRNGTDTAVILLDLDHFKSINDRYGHETGDGVLKKIAAVTGKVVRGSDCVGRWGGEEFLAVLPAANETGAENVAERIRDEIARVSVTIPEGGTVPVTATVGVAVHRPGERPGTATLSLEETRAALISAADTAMYSGKAAGRNCVACAPRPDGSHGG